MRLRYDENSEWHVRSPINAPLRRLLWFSCGLYVVCLACFVALAFASANYEPDCDKPFYYYPGSTLVGESEGIRTFTTDASYEKVYAFFNDKLDLHCDRNRCSGTSDSGSAYVMHFAPQSTTPTQYTLKVTHYCGLR